MPTPDKEQLLEDARDEIGKRNATPGVQLDDQNIDEEDLADEDDDFEDDDFDDEDVDDEDGDEEA